MKVLMGIKASRIYVDRHPVRGYHVGSELARRQAQDDCALQWQHLLLPAQFVIRQSDIQVGIFEQAAFP